MNRFKFVLVFILLFLFTFPAVAKEIKEHPLIRPFPGSILAKSMSDYKSFNGYDFYFINDETKKREKKSIKGEYWRLIYEVRTPSGNRVKTISKLEFFENYKMAAQEKGGQVVFEDVGQIVLTIPRDDGGMTWLRVSGNAGLGQQDLIIVDEKPFQKSLVFGPAQLKDALDKDGRIALYGILFDLDKATLKPESIKQLQHVVTLLLDNPKLKLEIQGHTDDQGSAKYNLTLSQQRAEAVKQYLQLFCVDPARLVPKGYGKNQPVAPNTTEDGRAKNRRVELVKL
ncbi:MAG: OmpA family protein [Syntrophaceae bacterium]|nr:OmpA family protein [Syntrophaceae bacterium]